MNGHTLQILSLTACGSSTKSLGTMLRHVKTAMACTSWIFYRVAEMQSAQPPLCHD